MKKKCPFFNGLFIVFKSHITGGDFHTCFFLLKPSPQGVVLQITVIGVIIIICEELVLCYPDLCPVLRGELSCIVHSDYCNCLHLHQPSCRDFLSPRGPLGHWRVILFPGAIHESLIGWNTGRALVFLNPPCRQLYSSNEIQAHISSDQQAPLGKDTAL